MGAAGEALTPVCLQAVECSLRVSVADNCLQPAAQELLRTIALGVDDPRKLPGFMGIRKELAVEILLDLLRRNLVLLNLETGRLVMASGVSEELTSGDARSRSDAIPARRKTVVVCYLPQLDIFLPRQRLWTTTYPPGWKSLPLPEIRGVREITRAEFAVAASVVLPRGSVVRDVIDVITSPGILRVDVVRLPAQSSAEDDFAAYPQGSAEWSRPQMLALNAALREMEIRYPDLWATLPAISRPARQQSSSRSTVWLYGVEDIAANISNASMAPADRPRFAALVDEAMDLLATASDVRAICGVDAIRDWVACAAAEAEEELVLGSAFISTGGEEWLERKVFARARRGVRVAMGIGMSREYTEDQKALLGRAAAFQYACAARIVVDEDRGACSHAKYAVRDRNASLVGSCNFLSAAASPGLFECALALGSGATQAIFKVVSRTLSAGVRKALPMNLVMPSGDALAELGSVTSGKMERRGSVSPELLEPPGNGDVRQTRQWLRSVAALLRDESVAWSAESLVGVRVSVVRALGKAAAAMEMLGLSPCQTVSQFDHRLLMFEGMERCRKSILIGSHRLSGRSATPKFVRSVREVLARGCNVVLLWGEGAAEQVKVETAFPCDQRSMATRDVIRELRLAAEGCPGRLFVNEEPIPWHAKIVIVDGRVTAVGSYEYLNLVAGLRREVSEMSVLCVGERVGREMLGAVVTYLGTLDAAFAGSVETAFAV